MFVQSISAFLNSNAGILTFVGLLGAFIMFLRKYAENRKSKRIRRFEKICSTLRKKEKTLSYENMMNKWYKKEYKENFEGNYLLYKKALCKNNKWFHQREMKLIKLKSIKIRYFGIFHGSNVNAIGDEPNDPIVAEKYYQQMKNIFPEPKKSFVFNAIEYLKKKYWSDTTFALKDFSMDYKTEKVVLDVYVGKYFSALNTCMPFQYETAYEDIFKNLKEPSRKSLRRKFPLLKTDNRFVKIGVSILTIIRNIESENNGTRQNIFLLHRRSGPVAAQEDQIHVVPSGEFQPVEIDFSLSREIIENTLNNSENLMTTVEREFAEEILGKPEVIKLGNCGVLRKYFPKNDLDNTYLLGAGFYPLDTHFDIFGITVIDACSHILGYSLGELKHSLYELNQKHKGEESFSEGKIEWYPFDEVELRNFLNNQDATLSLKSLFELILDDFEYISEQLNLH